MMSLRKMCQPILTTSEFLSGFGIERFFYIFENKAVFKGKKASAHKLTTQFFVDAIRMKFLIKRFNRINNFDFVVHSTKTQVFIFLKCTKNCFFLYAMFIINNDRLTVPNPHFIAIGFRKNSNNLFIRICFFKTNIVL